MVTFPKIGNDWPNLAQPPEPGANFDYSRWQNARATLKLFYVKFDNTYNDVLYFDTDAERDAFFNDYGNGVSTIVTLTSGFDKFPLDSLRIPIPYNDAQRYNYCFIEITLPADGLQYQTEYRLRRYYFVTDSKQLAPSTTEIQLEYDVWTNDARHMEISSAVLTRGHYAAQVKASDYLANPAANSRYLLAKDVDFSDGGTTCGTGVALPRMNDERAVCALLGIAPDAIANIGTIDYVANPGYSFFDIPDTRNGYQKGITYNRIAAHTTLSIMPAAPDTAGDTLSQVYLYEIDNVTEWFDYVVSHMPHVLQTLKCICAVPKALISRDIEYTFGDGVMMWSLAKADDTFDITLDTGMFGFDADVKEFAKLYTYPYSWLEYQRPDGTKTDIRIETIGGSFGQRRAFSCTDPLQVETYLFGIGGDTTHMWHDLKDVRSNVLLPSGLYDTLEVFGVPCIGLDISGFTDAGVRLLDIDHDIDVLAAQYVNAANSANSARMNALDGDSAQHANSDASANTANTNSLASNATANTNALEDNANDKTNRDLNNGITHYTNEQWRTTESWINTRTIAMMSNQRSASRVASRNALVNTSTADLDIHNAQIAKITNDENADAAYTSIATTQRNDYASATTAFNNAGSVVQSVTGNAVTFGGVGGAIGAMGGPIGVAGGALAGAALGLIQGGISCAVSSFSSGMAITNDSAAAANAIAHTRSKAANARTEATAIFTAQHTMMNDNTNISIDLQYDLANEAISANTDNNSAISACKQDIEQKRNDDTATIIDNDKTQRDTDANRIKATDDANANRTMATALANAARTHDTADANATYTRNTTIENAQRTFGTAYDGIMRDMDTLRLQRVTRGAESGDPSAANFERDVNRIVPRTQLKPCIRMAGETFARFGYAYGGIISFTGFKLANTRRFAYWQLDNVWYSNDTAENVVTGAMRDILHKGVTVWYDYAEMCTGSVFDN